jgi:hypothetical protein
MLDYGRKGRERWPHFIPEKFREMNVFITRFPDVYASPRHGLLPLLSFLWNAF